MNCHEWTDCFDDFLDGRLDAAEAEELRAHVAGCPSCAGELASIRELRDLAAAAAVVIVSSVVTAYFIGRSQAVATARTPAVAESGPSEVLLASFEGLGVNNYLATRTELLVALAARKHELSDDTMDLVMANLLVIDQAMDRIAEALDEDPENEFLMKRLAGAYRRQIDLLRRAVRMPAEI
jgi:hypothetical protein